MLEQKSLIKRRFLVKFDMVKFSPGTEGNLAGARQSGGLGNGLEWWYDLNVLLPTNLELTRWWSDFEMECKAGPRGCIEIVIIPQHINVVITLKEEDKITWMSLISMRLVAVES